jgi:DNA-binding NarL/FixJ family response regulator
MTLTTDRKTVRALIVGPDAIVRLGLRTLLQATGRISIVADVEPAWDAIGQIGQLWLDVVVLHGTLTGPAGAPLLSELRTLVRHVPVLVLADECSPAAVEQALRCGATGYLVTGQYAPDELLAAVLATANGQPRLSPEVVGILVNRLRIPQPGAQPPRPARLSPRETEIVESLAHGRTNAEIAELLGISEKTVKNHVNHVYAKLHTRNRAETVARWLGPEPPVDR